MSWKKCWSEESNNQVATLNDINSYIDSNRRKLKLRRYIMTQDREPVKKVKSENIILLNWLFYYFKACGVAPINFEFKLMNCGKLKRWMFTTNRSSLFYNLALIFGIAVANYYSMLLILDPFYKYDKHYFYMQLISMLSSIFILIICCIQHSKLPATLNAIVETKEAIVNAHLISISSKLSHEITLIFIISSALWFATNFTLCLYPDGLFRFQPLLLSTSDGIQTALALQYIFVLKFFKYFLKMINDRFLSLSNNALFDKATSATIAESDLELHNFLRLRNSFSAMCKISQELSNYYSFLLLLFLIAKFVIFTIQLYFIVELILKSEVFVAIIAFFICTFYILDCGLFMVLLASSVSGISNERGRTCEIINIYLENSCSPKIREKLQQFFIYLLHDNMRFAVFDLFSLNGTFLVSIAGSVMTYLVILLQFE